MYLKKAQSEKPCLYEIPYDQSDPANRLVPDKEETLTLEKESQSKLNKDLVRPYDPFKHKLNSLYENFKPSSQEYHGKVAHANEGMVMMRTTKMEWCMIRGGWLWRTVMRMATGVWGGDDGDDNEGGVMVGCGGEAAGGGGGAWRRVDMGVG
ncbi:hypothetical protein Tco_0684825 [Tanacetum coccineum]